MSTLITVGLWVMHMEIGNGYFNSVNHYLHCRLFFFCWDQKIISRFSKFVFSIVMDWLIIWLQSKMIEKDDSGSFGIFFQKVDNWLFIVPGILTFSLIGKKNFFFWNNFKLFSVIVFHGLRKLSWVF